MPQTATYQRRVAPVVLLQSRAPLLPRALPHHHHHQPPPQDGFLDAVQARDVEAVGMYVDEGYQVHSKSLLEAVRLGALDIVKVCASFNWEGAGRDFL